MSRPAAPRRQKSTAGLLKAIPTSDFWTAGLKGVAPIELRLDKKFVEVHRKHSIGSFAFAISKNEIIEVQDVKRPTDEAALRLLGCWFALLCRYCRSEEIVVGVSSHGSGEDGFKGLTPKSTPLVCSILKKVDGWTGPEQTEVEEIKAKFFHLSAANPLHDGAGSDSFEDISDWASSQSLGAAVKQSIACCVENSAAKLNTTRLCKQLGLNVSDQATHPLFQTTFVNDGHTLATKSASESMWPISSSSVPVALQLRVAVGAKGGLQLRLSFLTDWFCMETIETMSRHLKRLLLQATCLPAVPLNQLSMMDSAEQEQVLQHWSDATDPKYPNVQWAPAAAGGGGGVASGGTTVHSLFEECAAADPSRIALISRDTRVTYGQFNTVCDHFAAELREHGVQAETLVALLFERGMDMMVRRRHEFAPVLSLRVLRIVCWK